MVRPAELADGVGGKGSDSADTIRSLAIFNHPNRVGSPLGLADNLTKRPEVGDGDLNPIDFINI